MKTLRTYIPLLLVVLSLGIISTQNSAYAEMLSWQSKVTADTNKSWTITFNREISESSVREDTIYVLDSSGERKGLSYQVEGESIKASPLAPYKAGEDYTLWIVGVSDVEGNTLSRGVSMDFEIARIEPVPSEVRSVLLPDRFKYEPELTQKIFDKNQDIGGLFGKLMEVDSWIFSFDGELDQAHINIVRPEDAIISPPMDIPMVAILNYHIYLASEKLEAVRGKSWINRAYDVARSWGNRTQRISETRYMRQAHPGFDIYDASATEDGRSILAINIDPYYTWSFTAVSPFLDIKNLETTDGTYVVASRKKVVFPLGIFSN